MKKGNLSTISIEIDSNPAVQREVRNRVEKLMKSFTTEDLKNRQEGTVTIVDKEGKPKIGLSILGDEDDPGIKLLSARLERLKKTASLFLQAWNLDPLDERTRYLGENLSKVLKDIENQSKSVSLEEFRTNPGATTERASRENGTIAVVNDRGETVWHVQVPRYKEDQ